MTTHSHLVIAGIGTAIIATEAVILSGSQPLPFVQAGANDNAARGSSLVFIRRRTARQVSRA